MSDWTKSDEFYHRRVKFLCARKPDRCIFGCIHARFGKEKMAFFNDCNNFDFAILSILNIFAWNKCSYNAFFLKIKCIIMLRKHVILDWNLMTTTKLSWLHACSLLLARKLWLLSLFLVAWDVFLAVKSRYHNFSWNIKIYDMSMQLTTGYMFVNN